MDVAAGQGKPRVTAGIPERLAVSVLALGTVAALLLLRSLDDNTLTSWRWVFAERAPAPLYALVAGGIVLAHLAARLPLAGRAAAAVLFVSSYAIAACFWGVPEVIVDASRYFTQAKHLEVYGIGHFLEEWGTEIRAWTDLPLVPFLYGLVFELSGESRTHVQAFTTLLFAASAVLTYRVGRALWDGEVGFMAGALLLAIPYLLTQVPTLLVDVPTMFFVTLAIFALVEAFQRGGTPRILFASLAVSLAALSKYSAWLMLTVLPVVGIAHRGKGARPLRTGSAIAALSGTLVVAAVLARRDVFSEQLALLLGYQAPGLRRWGESFVSTFLFQVHPFLTAAAVISAWIAIRRRDPRYVIVAWPMLLLAGLQIRRARYLVPAFPMLALMAAYGLQALRTSEIRKLVVGCAVLSSLAVALYGYLPFLRSTSAANLRSAGEYLDSLDEEYVEVFTSSRPDSPVNAAVSVPILDLFTEKKLIHRPERLEPPPAAKVDESPLRFTWDTRSPGYYAAAGGAERDAAVVVISDDLARPLPEDLASRLRDHRLVRTFATDEGVFRHRTLVQVHRAAARR